MDSGWTTGLSHLMKNYHSFQLLLHFSSDATIYPPPSMPTQEFEPGAVLSCGTWAVGWNEVLECRDFPYGATWVKWATSDDMVFAQGSELVTLSQVGRLPVDSVIISEAERPVGDHHAFSERAVLCIQTPTLRTLTTDDNVVGRAQVTGQLKGPNGDRDANTETGIFFFFFFGCIN